MAVVKSDVVGMALSGEVSNVAMSIRHALDKQINSKVENNKLVIDLLKRYLQLQLQFYDGLHQLQLETAGVDDYNVCSS